MTSIQPYTETPDGDLKATLDIGFEVTRYNCVTNEWELHPMVDFEDALQFALDMRKFTEDENNTVKIRMFISCYNGDSILTDTKDLIIIAPNGQLVVADEVAERLCEAHLTR